MQLKNSLDVKKGRRAEPSKDTFKLMEKEVKEHEKKELTEHKQEP